MKRPLMVLAFLGLFSTSVEAEILIDDMIGFSWESGGYPPSIPGDQFSAVGTVGFIVNELNADLEKFSYTWYARDFVSTGEVIFGTTRVVTYAGGKLSIHADGLPSNHEYGSNPPNATVPSTFTDGSAVFLEGEFEDFFLIWRPPVSVGDFIGRVEFTGGDALGMLPQYAWDFRGDLSTDPVPPMGYDLRIHSAWVGLIVLSTEPSSWGAIKALYR